MTASERVSWLAGHPERTAELSLAEVPAVILEMSALLTALSARLATGTGQPDGDDDRDRLLTVKEASVLLGGISEDFLYRSEAAKALRVRLGGRVLISYRRAQEYMRRRAGRE